MKKFDLKVRRGDKSPRVVVSEGKTVITAIQNLTYLWWGEYNPVDPVSKHEYKTVIGEDTVTVEVL